MTCPQLMFKSYKERDTSKPSSQQERIFWCSSFSFSFCKPHEKACISKSFWNKPLHLNILLRYCTMIYASAFTHRIHVKLSRARYLCNNLLSTGQNIQTDQYFDGPKYFITSFTDSCCFWSANQISHPQGRQHFCGLRIRNIKQVLAVQKITSTASSYLRWQFHSLSKKSTFGFDLH